MDLWLFLNQRIIAASLAAFIYFQPDESWYGVIRYVTAIDEGQAESRKSA